MEITHLVHAEQRLILRHQGISRLGKNLNQRTFIQGVQAYHHRKTTHELGYHPELDKIPCFYLAKQLVPLGIIFANVRLRVFEDV